MAITKEMASPTSKWMQVRNQFEEAYDIYTKEQFLERRLFGV